jgi:transcriptional regulator with XRE-family HTH domain
VLKSIFTEEYESFLENLIAARKGAAITQQELALRLKKPQSFVSKYERRERRLDVVEFVTICGSIDVDPCRIIREIERRLRSRAKRGSG